MYAQNRLIHPFSRRYLVHITIILISLLVVTANLNAYEVKRDDSDYSSVISKVLGGEDFGSLEEGPVETKKITRYLDLAGVENKPQFDETAFELELEPSTVAGGSAVVRPILSPTEEKKMQRDEIAYYTVEPGDTISTIAQSFGVSMNTILWENNLTGYSIIRPGQKLTILPTSGLTHKVAKNETIIRIAEKYKTDAEKIVTFNKLASADDIKIGETLIVPGGVKPQVVQTYALRTWSAPTVSAPSVSISGIGKMAWPNSCRTITQYYSWRHYGLDIACPAGSTIYAADSGRVIKAQGGYNGGYGIIIVIDHGKGIQTLYAHLSKLYVTVGDKVEKGQAIGAEGSTGRSSGPHLHFEVRVNGVRKNPLIYL